MEFKNDAQRDCFTKVSAFARELFGEMAMISDRSPAFAIAHGSAFTETRVLAWGESDAILVTRAYVVTGAEMAPDLMRYLLLKNGDMLFGAFGIDDDDNIFFDHTILGSTIDKAELRASVMAVIACADRLDDEIMARWGGQRAAERVMA